MPRGRRKKGADSHKWDAWLMPALISFCEFYTRVYEASEWSAIRAWLKIDPTIMRVLTRGSSIETTMKRLHRKMQVAKRYKYTLGGVDYMSLSRGALVYDPDVNADPDARAARFEQIVKDVAAEMEAGPDNSAVQYKARLRIRREFSEWHKQQLALAQKNKGKFPKSE